MIRCFDVPQRQPLRWVVGVPLAAGLLLLAARAGWRRLRRGPAPRAAPDVGSASVAASIRLQ